MERLIATRTSIIIAHRLSTVQAVDRILVFEHGRIVEDGDHAPLLRRPQGHYRRLFDRQSDALNPTFEPAREHSATPANARHSGAM
jgi:ATP-binding cassette subfamily B protein